MAEDAAHNVYVQMLTIISERTGVSRKDVDRVLTESVRFWRKHPNASALVNALPDED